MKNNGIIAIISILMTLTGMLCVGCGQSVPEKTGERIGIIGAMAEEVDVLKNEAQNLKTTELSGMDFCEGTFLRAGSVPVISLFLQKSRRSRFCQILAAFVARWKVEL